MKFASIKNAIGKNAEIHFYGDIVSSTWNKWQDEDTCPQDIQDFFKKVNSYENLDIHINSGGGSVFAGIAIYNMLKSHNGNKTVYIDGLAASIASVIAMAGDTIKMNTGSIMMIHKPWIGYASGNSEDFSKLADTLEKIENSLIEIYQTKLKSNVTVEKLKEMLSDETWLSGEDAKEYFDIEVASLNIAAHIEKSEYFNSYKKVPDIIKNNNKKEVMNVTKEEILASIGKLSEDEKKEIVNSLNEKPKKVTKTEAEINAEIEAKAIEIADAKLKRQSEEAQIKALTTGKVVPALEKYVIAGINAMLNDGKFEEVEKDFRAMEELKIFSKQPDGVDNQEGKDQSTDAYATYNNIVKGGNK